MLTLLVAEDVAAWLGVTVAWVYAETRADRNPHIRVGRYLPLPAVEHRRVAQRVGALMERSHGTGSLMQKHGA